MTLIFYHSFSPISSTILWLKGNLFQEHQEQRLSYIFYGDKLLLNSISQRKNAVYEKYPTIYRISISILNSFLIFKLQLIFYAAFSTNIFRGINKQIGKGIFKKCKGYPMKNALRIVVALLLFTACNKEPQYKTVYLDPVLKATFNYKPGSYFIFKDSITGELDSVYLVSNLSKIDERYTDTRGFKYEYMYLYFDAKNISKNDSSNLVMMLSFSSKDGNHLVCGMKSGFQPLYSVFLYPGF